MSGALFNLAAMTVASTGTGTITLGSAATINGVTYLSFAGSGVADQTPVYYSINDIGQSEIGLGTYSTSGTSLTRGPITSTNANAAINMTAAAIVKITPPTSQFREVLTAARTYYVRSDGLDTNTGLVNSAGGAFLTIQKAINVIYTLDLATFNITIQIGTTGTWTEAVIMSGALVGSGAVTLIGNSTTWTTSGGTGIPITVKNAAVLTLATLTFATNSVHIRADLFGTINIGTGLNFGVCTTYHIYASNFGIVTNNNTFGYTISGNASVHIETEGGEININGVTITLTGTPAFGAYANPARFGFISYFSNTFSGSATGQRYSATGNSVIFANAVTTYLPGNAAGTTSTGGQYF